MTLLVIFGAGASFDSVAQPWSADMDRAEPQWRPPVASDLFDIAARPETMGKAAIEFNEVVGLAGRLRALASAGAPIEEELERIQQRADDPAAIRQLTATRYYIDNVIASCAARWLALSSGNTNYRTLISHIDQLRRDANETVLWVTFNYDTLLDLAAAHELGRPINKPHAFISANDHLFFKLHGSTSWRRLAGYRNEATRVRERHPASRPDPALGQVRVRLRHQRSER